MFEKKPSKDAIDSQPNIRHWSGFGEIQTVHVFAFCFMAFWLSFSSGDLAGLFWN